MARELGIDQRIIDAKPTDGLWDDGRVDEDQLNGMSYKELEECMKLAEAQDAYDVLEEAEVVKVDKYNAIRSRNLHKMNPIPVFIKP